MKESGFLTPLLILALTLAALLGVVLVMADSPPSTPPASSTRTLERTSETSRVMDTAPEVPQISPKTPTTEPPITKQRSAQNNTSLVEVYLGNESPATLHYLERSYPNLEQAIQNVLAASDSARCSSASPGNAYLCLPACSGNLPSEELKQLPWRWTTVTNALLSCPAP